MSDTKIFNYLNLPISIVGFDCKGNKRLLAFEIPPLGVRKFKLYLAKGNRFSVYLFKKNEPVLFSNYIVNTNEKLNEIHIGMVSSRFIGSTDNLRSVTSNYAVSGCPFVTIHNMTKTKLYLNNDIIISPGDSYRYQGRYHYGVPLGTIFRDKNGLFPEFILKFPCTDLYYGMISNLVQPSFGGYAVQFDDLADNAMFPLQEGVI